MPSENPHKSTKRKLTAILFADIQGYTALMQKDETRARRILTKFRDTLNHKVAENNGQIINDLGDGCLCTFDSAVDAIKCAKEAQDDFLSEPRIPVRIGLHSGDVFFEADNVYGDSVNIASRIESLGVAGSILFSKRIRQHIENQPDFKIELLGEFDFKNVNKTMQVYALANEGLVVPSKDEMRSKKRGASKKFNKFWYFLIPLLVVVGGFGIAQWQKSSPPKKITTEILNQRIAVIPFKNNTNDVNLEILGDMSADWINRGLMEIEDIEVVSPQTARSNIAALGILANDPQGRTSFSELTGAQNMLTGNYYVQGEDIIFQLQIQSAIDGQIRFIFDPIRGPVNNKEALLNDLGSQVAGYWVTRDLVDLQKIRAPNYEAYLAYHDALRFAGAGDEYIKVFELDSTFYLARLHFLNLNRSGVLGSNREQFDFLDRHASELSTYETAWFNYLKGLYSGDGQLAFESLNNLRMKYPKDFMINHETAVVAGEIFNNFELQLEIYGDLPIEEVDANSVGIYYGFRIMNHVIAYLKLGQMSNLSTFLDKVKGKTEKANALYRFALLLKALYVEDPDEIDNAYAQLLKTYETDKYFFFLGSSLVLYSTKLSSIRERLRSDFLSFYHKLDSSDINRTIWKPQVALMKGESQNIHLSRIKKMPQILAISTLASEALLNPNNGQADKVDDYITELMRFTTTGYDAASLWGTGLASYSLGKIFAKMGNQNEAIRHLKEARKSGYPVYLSFYKYDIDLAHLVGIPEFDAITDPIWPELKN